MKIPASILSLTMAAALSATAPAARAALILNGGFEDDLVSQTSSQGVTNKEIPAGWFASDTFINNQQNNSWSSVRTHSGSGALTIGGIDGDPPPVLSQAFQGVAGATYHVDFWTMTDLTILHNGVVPPDPNGFLTVGADRASKTEMENSSQAFAEDGFDFVSEGSDIIFIAASTDNGHWYVDDVSVTLVSGPAGGAPEPAAWALMLLGFGVAGAGLRRRRRASTTA